VQDCKVFDRPPSSIPAFVRALFGKRKGGAIPHLRAELALQRVDLGALARYRRQCGFVDGPHLPLTYPQVLAGALHLHLLTHPKFPLSSLGLVHMRNVIEQTRAIDSTASLHLAAHLDGERQVPGGTEIDLVTEASVHGEVVWRSVITALARTGKRPRGDKRPRGEKKPPGEKQAGGDQQPRPAPAELSLTAPFRSLLIRVPEDQGRQYAAVAGDFNPIHLYATTAKLFGFPRAIVHGMWSLGRCLGELESDLAPGSCRVEVAFKRPVLLPSTVVLRASRPAHAAGAVEFALTSRDGATVHLVGTAHTS